MMLGLALMQCPLVGLVDDIRVAHRVNMDGLPAKEWRTAEHATAACGAQVKLLNLRWEDLRTRGRGITRCKPCRDWRAS